MMKLSLLLLFLLMLLCTACSPITIYEEVKVPIKCTLPPTPKPTYSNNLEIDLSNILIYDELLQEDLKTCRGEN